ncbi:MAG: methyltransferase domain-containing protein [bacterium]
MKKRLMDFLCCPNCGNKFELEIFQIKDEVEIEEGLLKCNCSEIFPIIKSIPRILPDAFETNLAFCEKHKSNLPKSIILRLKNPQFKKLYKQTQSRFEFQWKQFAYQKRIFGKTKEDAMNSFFKFSPSNITKESLSKKLVLDAGCGHGVYVENLGELGCEVIGLDIGVGVDITLERCRHLNNIHVVQGNILSSPFIHEAFDYIWCNGVIHHTPDTRQAFSCLSKLIKKGCYLSIWVYPKGSWMWEISQKFIRSITTRLPEKLLYYLCFIPVPLLSVVKTYSGTSLKNSSWRECAQVVYDWYSPEYQSHHTIDEVKDWFEKEGFEDIEIFSVPVGMAGKKI